MSEETPENEMSIWDHIAELRNRLLWGMGALVVTTGLSIFYLTPIIIDILAWPAGGAQKFVAIDPTETVGVYMRVSLLAGFIIALPFILYQVIAFIVPGLYPKEKRALFTAIPLATLLFFAGVSFTYYVMLPAALTFLRDFLTQVTPMWRLANYINFITNLMFWIGLAFETPLVVFILAKFGLVTSGMLLKQWRFAVVIIALAAAIITPTVDPVNMSLLMAPLFVIYLLSALFAALARPTERVKAASEAK
jgi:sec-independent protein translocase protein TatC